MLITICDVPEHYKAEIVNIGGVVGREWGDIIDVRFSEHKMYVRDNYIKLRSKDHKALILSNDEFSAITVQ